MANIFQFGPEGRHILVDASGRMVVNSLSSAAPFIYAYGPEGHPLAVDASGRLLISDIATGSSGVSGAIGLDGLTDVIITTPTNGQIIQYDGVFWENVNNTVENLSNVTGSAISGQFLSYNGSNWVASDVSLTLDELSNVIISTPSTNDALIYNGANWVASGLSAIINSNVTYEALDSNGDIGAGSGQVASGLHSHNFEDLTNMSFSGAQSGDIARYNGSIWQNSNILTKTTPIYDGMSTTPLTVSIYTSGATPDVYLSVSGYEANNTFTAIENQGQTIVGSGDSIQLIAGNNSSLQANYAYYSVSGSSLVLETSTTGFPPSGSHVRVAEAHIQSSSGVASDGPIVFVEWSDEIEDERQIGHLSDINTWIKYQSAKWLSGVSFSGIITTNPSTADNVGFSGSAGKVLLSHEMNFDQKDFGIPSSSGVAFVTNYPSSPYLRIQDLNELLVDSNNSSLVNKYFTLVIWGVVNPEGMCQLMVNLPNGSYTNEAKLLNDVNVISDYSIPSEFSHNSFLITELKLRHQNANNGTWTLLDSIDLRGYEPSNSVGGLSRSVSLLLDELNDVTITAASSGQYIQYNGSEWINTTVSAGTSSLSGLTDTSVSGASPSEVLVYNGSVWIPSGITYPVDSVNGQTGNVVITASGLGALTSSSGIDDLSDVNTSGVSIADSLVYDGANWVPSGITVGAASLSGLTDTNVSGVSNSDVLVYSGSQWVPSGIAFPVDSVNGQTGDVTITASGLGALTTSSVIGDLSDVTIASATSGEILQYDNSTIVNRTLSEAGISEVGHSHDLNDLSDVNTSGVAQTDVIAYDGAGWVASGISFPVISVNGQTGTVLITASGLGALTPSSGIDDLSDVNTSGVSAADSLVYDGANWVPSGVTAPVTSVNSQTGDVTITASGLGALTSSSGIDDLSDVIIVSATSGEILQYSGSTIVNRTLSEAGVSEVGHTHAINDLSDVNTAGVTQANVIAYNGASWVASGISFPVSSVNGQTGAVVITASALGALTSSSGINDLSDVNTSGVSTADSLVYDGANWVPSGVTAGSASLSGLTDTSVSGASNTEALIYDGNQWVASGLSTIIDSRVTYETLDTNGDVGVGSSQLASGSHSHALQDLTNVSITSASSGQTIEYDGSDWVNVTPSQGVTTLSALSDTNVSGVSNSDVLVYSGSQWVPSGITFPVDSVNGQTGTVTITASGLGALTSSSGIDDLSDVEITSATSGEILQYSGTTIINRTLSEAGISEVGHSHNLNDLSDVSTAGVTQTDVIAYNGASWVASGISFPVTSVNGQTGAVVITASGLGALTSSSGINNLSDVNTAGVSTADSLVYNGANWVPSGVTAPVTSVNSQTGDVVITASGLGALTSSSGIDDLSDVTIASATSGEILQYSGSTIINRTLSEAGVSEVGHSHDFNDLNDVNTAGVSQTDVIAYNGASWVASGITYPVDSVNGQTGTVVITASSLGALTSSSGIDDLSDVNTSGVSTADSLVYDGANWVPSGVTAPVTSVNSQTGDVTITATSLGALTSSSGIDDLSDVTITSAASGEILQYSGSTIVNVTLSEAGISEVGHTHAINDLSDVNTAGASSSDVIAYNGASWVASGVTFPVTSVNSQTGAVTITATSLGALTSSSGIDNLSDVAITSATSGQLLRYNGSNWVNYENVPYRDKVNTVGSDFSITANNVYLFESSSGALTGTLPSSPLSGDRVILKDKDGQAATNRLSIETPSAETIDGASSYQIGSNFGSLTLISDGTNWFIV